MKKYLLLIAILSLIMIVSGCGKKNVQTEQKTDVPALQEQAFEKKQIGSDADKNQQPNALDYMAPGYRQAQDKLKQVQDLRQKEIDANMNDIENVNY